MAPQVPERADPLVCNPKQQPSLPILVVRTAITPSLHRRRFARKRGATKPPIDLRDLGREKQAPAIGTLAIQTIANPFEDILRQPVSTAQTPHVVANGEHAAAVWSHALSAEGFDVRIVVHVDAAQEWFYWEAEGGGGGPFAAADELAVGIAWSVSGLEALVPRRRVGLRKLTGGARLRETRRPVDEGIAAGWQVVKPVSLNIRNIREPVLTWKECMLPRRAEGED